MNQKSYFYIDGQARSFKLFLDRFILTPNVRNSIEEISKHSSVYIFSGIIRDFLTGVIDVVRDCDIVINPGQDFKIPVSLLRKARYERNQFGGLKIMGDDMSLDVWFLENTWGIVKEGDIPEVDSLLKRTFFNFSSIVFDYTNEKFIYTEDFVVFIQTNTMEVVYPLNPNNELCVVNTFYFSDKRGIAIGRSLKQWISSHYDENMNFESMQARHFHKIIYTNDTIKKRVMELIGEEYKIDWDRYLNSGRARQNSGFREYKNKNAANENRSDFESDLGRVLFSSALRRMHDKTQVVPLTTGDSVHTRLTHSLEVMNVAESLGLDYCRRPEFIRLYGEKQAYEIERKMISILRSAALIHDIGNPPFGHFGETIIQNYFKEYLTTHIITDEQALDFTCFDGNAQGLRVVSKLQYIGDLYGLNLTYATLAAYMKYPNPKDIDKEYIGTKKHGVYYSEKGLFEKVVEACMFKKGDKIVRHPLSFLVEAADSICYLIMDVEDGFIMKWYSFNDIVKHLNSTIGEFKGDDEFDILKELKINQKKDDKEKSERQMMVDLRVAVIRHFVKLAVDTFVNNLDKIDSGDYTEELIEKDPLYLSKALAKFAKRYIFPQKDIEQLELTGYSVLRGLLDILIDYVFKDDAKFRNHSKSVISRTCLKVAMHETSNADVTYMNITEKDIWEYDVEKLTPYYKLRLIVDFVSGMTDRYAVTLYQKLSGQRL